MHLKATHVPVLTAFFSSGVRYERPYSSGGCSPRSLRGPAPTPLFAQKVPQGGAFPPPSNAPLSSCALISAQFASSTMSCFGFRTRSIITTSAPHSRAKVSMPSGLSGPEHKFNKRKPEAMRFNSSKGKSSPICTESAPMVVRLPERLCTSEGCAVSNVQLREWSGRTAGRPIKSGRCPVGKP